MPGKHADPATRLWRSVTLTDDGCWLLPGSPKTYGNIRVDGRQIACHIYAWTLTNGRPPKKGFVIRHTCDRPKCVNPDHLVEGTHAQNMQDMAERITATQCRAGHVRTPENTIIRPNGTRTCKDCKTISDQRYQREYWKTYVRKSRKAK